MSKRAVHIVPKVDGWAVALHSFGGYVLATMIPLIAWDPSIHIAVRVAAVLILALILLRLFDRLFFTTYTFTKQGLIVSTMVHMVHIPYECIQEARDVGLPVLFSWGHLQHSAALARGGVVLYLRISVWKRVSLSPPDADEFHELLDDFMNVTNSVHE